MCRFRTGILESWERCGCTRILQLQEVGIYRFLCYGGLGVRPDSMVVRVCGNLVEMRDTVSNLVGGAI